MHSPELLTPQEVADTLEIGRWAIIRMAKAGWLDPYVEDGKLYFLRADVRDILFDDDMSSLLINCPCSGPCDCCNLDIGVEELGLSSR